MPRGFFIRSLSMRIMINGGSHRLLRPTSSNFDAFMLISRYRDRSMLPSLLEKVILQCVFWITICFLMMR